MNYHKINNITGWVVFIIATTTYSLTVEPTASFWDVGEFIAVSYKLMVPHPPGAPLFLLIGRMFSFLSLGDTTMVAFWINMISAISSGFTILLMFWSITLIGQKILKIKGSNTTLAQLLSLMGAGVVGALSYTFSDTFWFSAVEGEVYALSSLLTAFVFWAMLKWEHIDDKSKANRWIILIAYVFGLSIGVHLLNLVTIPVLGLIYYFKKNKKATAKGLIYTLIFSALIIILINNIIIPGLPSFAGLVEIFLVNTIGLPFGSGIVLVILGLIGGLIYGIYYSNKNKKELLNVALLSLTFILIGYSSYTMVIIRSSYNPPIDENNPEDFISMISYLKREQYGTRPLFYGNYYTAEVIDQKIGAPIYERGAKKYNVINHKIKQVYDPKHMTLLPRVWSSSHAKLYEQKLGLRPGEKPTFFDNIRFMLTHQMGHMYWRYFMWNFSGRASDTQDADWLSIADAFEEVPESIAINRARNNYLMLPLLLGIIGLFFTYKKTPRYFYTLLTLFFLTGLALIIYLNSPASEPRERDYIYVGSFYAFCFFIGFGVLAIANFIEKFINNKVLSAVVAGSLSLSIPLLMAAENWDDHNRSNRYFSVDSAKNFLASCAPNAILFTGGDNDTFPLWYVQEVEGFRTDVRVVVLSYFNTEWYISQMTRPAYSSAVLPFSLERENYREGSPNDIVVLNKDLVEGAINLKTYLGLLKKSDKRLQFQTSFGLRSIIPSKSVYLDIDTATVLNLGIIPEKMENLVVDKMHIDMKGNYLEKKDLMIWDIISTNNWERPIYFNISSKQGLKFNIDQYLVQEGSTYRLLPIKRPAINVGQGLMVNTDIMYDNLVNKCFYRELNNPAVYYNEDYRKFVINCRVSFNLLTLSLIKEDKKEKAKSAILKSLELMPDAAIPFDYSTVSTVELLYQVGDSARALNIASTLGNRADKKLAYYIKTNNDLRYERQNNLGILRNLSQILNKYGALDLSKKFMEASDKHYQAIQM